MGIIRSFDIKRLKPFHREGNRMPKPAPEKMDELVKLDPDLRPDEQSYVSHYLNYADTLLETDDVYEGDAATPERPTKFSNILELPTIEEPEPAPSDEVDPILEAGCVIGARDWLFIPSAITSGRATHRVHRVIGKARRRKFDLMGANSERTTERPTGGGGSQSTEQMENRRNKNAA